MRFQRFEDAFMSVVRHADIHRRQKAIGHCVRGVGERHRLGMLTDHEKSRLLAALAGDDASAVTHPVGRASASS
jgi:hypothetical protein